MEGKIRDISLYGLLREWNDVFSIYITGGYHWKDKNSMDEVSDFISKYEKDDEIIVLSVSASLMGSGIDGTGFLIAVDKNNKIVDTLHVWIS